MGTSGSGAAVPPVVRAEVIAALLLGAAEAGPGGTAGVRLRGATVEGRLDLTSGNVAWPLVCDDCQFDTEISFADSALRTVRILNSDLPALDGTRMRLNGILDMAGSRVAGTVGFRQAGVDGQLRLRGLRAGTAGAGAVAVLARGLVVDGEADCAGMEARGLVSFEGAKVTGTVDLAGARVSCPGERALDLNYATVGGTLSCTGLAVDGETRASNCRVGGGSSCAVRGLTIRGASRWARGAWRRLPAVRLRPGVRARGEVALIGARLAANLSARNSGFDNPGGTALSLNARASAC